MEDLPEEVVREILRLEELSPGIRARLQAILKEDSHETSKIAWWYVPQLSRQVTSKFSPRTPEILRSYLINTIESSSLRPAFTQIAESLGVTSRFVSDRIKNYINLQVIQESFLVDYSYYHLDQIIFQAKLSDLLPFEKRYVLYNFPIINRDDSLIIGIIPRFNREFWERIRGKKDHEVQKEIFSVNLQRQDQSNEMLWGIPWRPRKKDQGQSPDSSKPIVITQETKTQNAVANVTFRHAILLDLLRQYFDIVSKEDLEKALEEFSEEDSFSERHLRKRLLPNLLQRKTITKRTSFQNIGLQSYYSLFVSSNSSHFIERISQELTGVPICHQYLSPGALLAIFGIPSVWENEVPRNVHQLKTDLQEEFPEENIPEFVFSPLPNEVSLPWEPTTSFSYCHPQNKDKIRFFTTLYDQERRMWHKPEVLL